LSGEKSKIKKYYYNFRLKNLLLLVSDKSHDY